MTKTNINLRKLSEFLSCEKKLPPADSLFKKVACVIEDWSCLVNDRTGQNEVRPNPEASAKLTEASAEASAESLAKK